MCAGDRIAAWLRRHATAVAVILVLIASGRIVSTYTILSHTFDEPAHIACGMEWLDTGTYHYEPQHPPLARAAIALGPYLAGSRAHRLDEMWDEGLAILYDGGHYDRTLALARLGILPFFWLAAASVYLWCRKYADELSAVLAVLIFTSLPPILAHAGLATTDMALTGTVGVAFLAGVHWFERPTLRNSFALGALLAIAVLTKFSAIAFLPVAFCSALLVHAFVSRPDAAAMVSKLKQTAPWAPAVLLSAFLLVWAIYRFSWGPIGSTTWHVPFPELFEGIRAVWQHDLDGDPASYLLGTHRDAGWWYYYPVALGVKTPLAVLALLALGLVVAVRQGRQRKDLRLALAFSGGILLFCLGSRINLGIRHVLPVYLGVSVLAAAGAKWLLEQRRLPAWTACALLGWLLISSAWIHPDYIAYFNAIAGSRPEHYLVDSDLDWGQDVKRLGIRLRELGAKEVAFSPNFVVDLKQAGFPEVIPIDLDHPAPGWNAMRVTVLELVRAANLGNPALAHFWLVRIPPTERIGKGIWLWYFPPQAVPPEQPAAVQLPSSNDTMH